MQAAAMCVWEGKVALPAAGPGGRCASGAGTGGAPHARVLGSSPFSLRGEKGEREKERSGRAAAL